MQTKNVPLWADEELNEVVMTVYEPTEGIGKDVRTRAKPTPSF